MLARRVAPPPAACRRPRARSANRRARVILHADALYRRRPAGSRRFPGRNKRSRHAPQATPAAAGPLRRRRCAGDETRCRPNESRETRIVHAVAPAGGVLRGGSVTRYLCVHLISKRIVKSAHSISAHSSRLRILFRPASAKKKLLIALRAPAMRLGCTPMTVKPQLLRRCTHIFDGSLVQCRVAHDPAACPTSPRSSSNCGFTSIRNSAVSRGDGSELRQHLGGGNERQIDGDQRRTFGQCLRGCNVTHIHFDLRVTRGSRLQLPGQSGWW